MHAIAVGVALLLQHFPVCTVSADGAMLTGGVLTRASVRPRSRLMPRWQVLATVAFVFEIACSSSVTPNSVRDGTAIPQAAAASPPKSDGAAADAGVSRPDAAVAEGGTWFETGLYKVRLVRTAACDDSSAESRPPEATRKRWVGLFLEFVSVKNESFTSPRDVTLKRSGIVLESRYHDAPALPGCTPLMKQKSLRSGEKLRGIVLFEIPASFDAAKGAITLAYRPTRWGGAAGVEMTLPDCFDKCVDTPARVRSSAPPKSKPRRQKASH